MRPIKTRQYFLEECFAESLWIINDDPDMIPDAVDACSRARAKLYFDLIEKYYYPPSRIEFDVISPEKKIIDVVVYEDREHARPYLIAKCREDWITDDAFKESSFEALGLAQSVGAKYGVCLSGSRRRVLRASTGEILEAIPQWRGV